MEYELKCMHCDRFLGKGYGTVVAELKCSNSACRGTTQFKRLQGDTLRDIRHKFATEPEAPKQKEKTDE